MAKGGGSGVLPRTISWSRSQVEAATGLTTASPSPPRTGSGASRHSRRPAPRNVRLRISGTAAINPKVASQTPPLAPKLALIDELAHAVALVGVLDLPDAVDGGAQAGRERLETLCGVQIRLDPLVDDQLQLAQGLLVLREQEGE